MRGLCYHCADRMLWNYDREKLHLANCFHTSRTSLTSNCCHGPSARRPGNLDGTGPGEAADQSADRGAGMSGGADVGVVQHGVTNSAHLPSGDTSALAKILTKRLCALGSDISLRPSPTLFSVSITAVESMESGPCLAMLISAILSMMYVIPMTVQNVGPIYLT